MRVSKLKAGRTYLAKKDAMWWLVQQEGQRSWNAMQFTAIHPHEYANARLKHGNASIMLDMFSGCEIHEYTNENHHLRRAIFNCSKFGKVEGDA